MRGDPSLKEQERVQQTDHAFNVETETIIKNAKHGFLRAETRLRANGDDTRGASILRETLDGLQTDLKDAFGRMPSDEDANAGTQMLMRELQPWLVRSRLADLCVGRSKGVSQARDILSHVLADTAAGEGPVGEQIDRWLLSPTHERNLPLGRPHGRIGGSRRSTATQPKRTPCPRGS